MEGLLLAVVTGAASFIGSWAAFKVELRYLRRDVDIAHHRINKLEERLLAVPCGK
jgi:hypothetical protein